MLTFFTDYGRLALTEAKELGKPFQVYSFMLLRSGLTEYILGVETLNL